jgi:5'(3')-deoxyribonucleotidase
MGYEFWRNLEQYPWADDLVSLVERAVGLENMAFCTSPAHQVGCMEGKIGWCKEYYPSAPVIITRSVPRQSAPKHFLAHPDVVLIDDYDKNVDTFREHGGKAILFPMPWNSNVDYYRQGLSMEIVTQCLELLVEESVA